MSADILVVFKKNFESVHDRAMDQIQSDLEKLVQERGIRVEFTAREKVRHSDFIGRDLVIVVGGDGTYYQHRSQCRFRHAGDGCELSSSRN